MWRSVLEILFVAVYFLRCALFRRKNSLRRGCPLHCRRQPTSSPLGPKHSLLHCFKNWLQNMDRSTRKCSPRPIPRICLCIMTCIHPCIRNITYLESNMSRFSTSLNLCQSSHQSSIVFLQEAFNNTASRRSASTEQQFNLRHPHPITVTTHTFWKNPTEIAGRHCLFHLVCHHVRSKINV